MSKNFCVIGNKDCEYCEHKPPISLYTNAKTQYCKIVKKGCGLLTICPIEENKNN